MSVDSYAGLIQAIIAERETCIDTYTLKNSKTGAIIQKLSRPGQAELAIALLHRYQQVQRQQAQANRPGNRLFSQTPFYISDTLLLILNRKLPFTVDHVLEFLTVFDGQRRSFWQWQTPIKKIVRNYLQEHPLTPELETAIAHACDILERGYGDWPF